MVLDLDETLVCAYETSTLPSIITTEATEAGLNWFELECVSSDKVRTQYLHSTITSMITRQISEMIFFFLFSFLKFVFVVLKECDGKPKINYVTVFERPGLHEFLKQLGTFADLVLFTAGLEGLFITSWFYFLSPELCSLLMFGYWLPVGYARPLVDKIDVENRFIRRLYRPSTTST